MRYPAWPLLPALALFAATPPEDPRPIAIWAAGPMEVRVAFEGPVDPAIAGQLAGRPIAFEVPGSEGPATLNIAAARPFAARGDALGDQTLVLFTDPHPREATYTLPPLSPGAEPLTYRPTGVEVAWAEGGGDPLTTPIWSGWWPEFDSIASRDPLVRSAGHVRQFADLHKLGRLSLRTFARLPEGDGVVRLEADAPFEATVNFEPVSSTPLDAGHRVDVPLEAGAEPVELSILRQTGGGAFPEVRASYRPEGSESFRSIAADRLLLPWVPPDPPAAATEAPAPPYELAGGDPERGRAIFRGEEAKCASCHVFRGEGGEIGPELTGLAGKGAGWLYQQIAEPSARIHPQYATYSVALKDGRVLVGVVRAEGSDRVKVLDISAQEQVVGRDEVDQLQPSGTSTMPVGLAGALGEAGIRDLLAYLLTGKE